MPERQGCLECTNRGGQLFCGLGYSDLARLERIGVGVTMEGGAEIFREGNFCSRVYVLCAGRVKLSTTSPSGRTVIVRIAGTGQVLGLAAALAGDQYEVTAETIEPSRVKAIRRADFLAFLQDNPETAHRAARLMASEYSTVLTEVKRLAKPSSASSRVASLLLDWTREPVEAAGAPARFMIPLTHEEIASMTATSRETVTRVLGRMRRDQLIQIRGAALTVLRRQALEKLAW